MLLQLSEIEEVVEVATNIPGKFDYFAVRDEVFLGFPKGILNRLPPPGKMNAESVCRSDLTFLNDLEARADERHSLDLWLSFLVARNEAVLGDERIGVIKRLREKAAVTLQRKTRTEDIGLPARFALGLRDTLESAVARGVVGREEILKALLQSIDRSPPPEASESEFFHRVAFYLCGSLIPQDAKTHMAVCFAVLMYHQGVDIMPWLGPLARQLDISDADLEQIVACPACVQIEDRVVVVVADREVDFRVAAWRVLNRPGRRDVRWSTVIPIESPSVDPVAANEREVFDRVRLLLQSAKLCLDTQVELCLPKRLLCCPLDGLKWKKRGIDYTVARNHLVLVRCWDRHFDPEFVTDPAYIEDWNAAWKEFQAGGSRKVHRVTPEIFRGEAESVVIRLKGQNSQGLILTCCPSTPVGGEGTVLDYLINAAVPVAILPREGDGLGVNLDDPASWRTTIKKIRADQIDSGLTLLWDDPEGVPGAMITLPRMSAPPLRTP